MTTMRGRRNPQASMLAFVDLEERVPPHHPLRAMKRFADRALAELSPTFDDMYGSSGRPSIPPERLDFQLTLATGTAERDVVPQLLHEATLRGFHPRTLGADKAYDTRACGSNPTRGRHAARCAEHQRSAQRDRWPNHLAARLRRQPTDPQAGGGDLRLDENDRRVA